MVIEGIFNNWYITLKRNGNVGGSKSQKIEVGYQSSFKEANNEYAGTENPNTPIERKCFQHSVLIDIHDLLYSDVHNASEPPKIYPADIIPTIIPKFTRGHYDYIYSTIFRSHPGIQIPKSVRISPLLYFGTPIIMPSSDNSVPPAIKEAIEIVERYNEDIGEDVMKGDKSHIMVLILPHMQSYIVMLAKLTYYLNMGESKDNPDGIKYRYVVNLYFKGMLLLGLSLEFFWDY
jgi:hypothetical protein